MEPFFSSDAGGILLLSLLVVFQVIEFSRNVAKYVVVIITVDVGRIEGFLYITEISQLYGTKFHFLIYLLKNLLFFFNKVHTFIEKHSSLPKELLRRNRLFQ